MKAESDHRILYGNSDTISIRGLCRLLMMQHGGLIKCIVGGLVVTVLYTKLCVAFQQYENEGVREILEERVDLIRKSGKLRGERFIVIPHRQVDDADFGNLPFYSPKAQPFVSAQLSDDNAKRERIL